MSWSLLGNVNNGWFARLAHGVEAVGRTVFGNNVYDSMDKVAENKVEAINQHEIQQAAARGLNTVQQLQSANDKLLGLVNPKSLTDVGCLLGTGFSTASQSVGKSPTTIPRDSLGYLIPLLIGFGVLGVGYIVVD